MFDVALDVFVLLALLLPPSGGLFGRLVFAKGGVADDVVGDVSKISV